MKDEPLPPEPPLDEEMDAALRDAYAFAPGAAEEAAARFRVPGPAPARWPLLLLAPSLAAGIAIGFWLLPKSPPEQPGVDVTAPPKPIGFLTVATGPVRTAKGRDLVQGDPIYEGEGVMTAEKSRATVVLYEGTELRLDRSSSVNPRGPQRDIVEEIGVDRRVSIGAGRVWARVTPGQGFLFDAGDSLEVMVTGTELSVTRTATTAGVQLFSGSATVNGSVELKPGQEVAFDGGALSAPRRFGSEALATGWMLDLVAKTGGHDRELAEHLDRLLIDMGRTKAVMIEERALVEDLGGSCRVPLARYLVSEGARLEDEPRRKAARVLTRIGDRSVAEELVRALRDPDGDVRVSAARALRRIADGAVTFDPEAFRAACDDGTLGFLESWLKSNPPPAPPK